MNDVIKTIADASIIKANKDILNETPTILTNVSSVYSSFFYYDTPELQIASVIRSLVKNHIFKDGNKRTSVIIFVTLCELNNIPIKNKRWEIIFIDIASSNYSVEQIAKLLF